MQTARSNLGWWPLFILLAWIAGATGCASLTNPIANGVPARLVPEELLAESQDEFEQVPLSWLNIVPPKIYRLDTGDIVGVYVEGALGDRDQLPPINFPQIADLPPSIGFPTSCPPIPTMSRSDGG